LPLTSDDTGLGVEPRELGLVDLGEGGATALAGGDSRVGVSLLSFERHGVVGRRGEREGGKSERGWVLMGEECFLRDEKKEDEEGGDAVDLIFVCLWWWCVWACGRVDGWSHGREKKLLPEREIENSSTPRRSGRTNGLQTVKHVRENR
jgi:hypothetical protein